MKSEERLRSSYELQKKIFDEAEARKLANLEEKRKVLVSKREDIDAQIEKIDDRLKNKKEFEDFESFRQKSLDQSKQSKESKGLS